MNIPRLERGKIPKIDQLNASIDAINRHLPIIPGAGLIGGSVEGGGTTISMKNDDNRGPLSIFPGEITDKGPDDEADYSDYRYWVKMLYNKVTKSNQNSRSAIDLQDDSDPRGAKYTTITAISISEFTSGSHGLAVGSQVWIARTIIDKANKDNQDAFPTYRYFIINAGGGGGDDFTPTEIGHIHACVGKTAGGKAITGADFPFFC